MKRTVYLLEDDKSICELVSCALEMSDVSLKYFHTVREFLAAVEAAPPELCLLDVMLPDGNGLDVLRRLKAGTGIPCIVLSALGQETDKVRGLNLGAEDYIAKPFGVLELSARVSAALRRVQRSATYAAGGICLDRETMKVSLDGREVPLNPKEYKLLVYLIDHEGKALGREQLLDAVWGYEYYGETRTVDNHIARLRKLGFDKYISTVFGHGYRFSAKKEDHS